MAMILLGVLLLVCGFLFALHLLVVLGIILLIVGVVLALLGTAGHAVGGRRWYW
jgi:multisubunit Na+/H+ antiporter MnhG subunit